MGSVRGQSEDAAASCHNEFQAKMSSTAALRYSLKLANSEAKALQTSINDTQDMLNAARGIQETAERKEIQLEKVLSAKEDLIETLGILVQNLTAEVQELHTTCNDILAIDCCQVTNTKHSVVMIILNDCNYVL